MKYTTITAFTVMMFVLFSFSFNDVFASSHELAFTATVHDNGVVIFEWDEAEDPSFKLYYFEMCALPIPPFDRIVCNEFVGGGRGIGLPSLNPGQEYIMTLRSIISGTQSNYEFGSDVYPVLSVTVPLPPIVEPLEFSATIRDDGSVLFRWDWARDVPIVQYSFQLCYSSEVVQFNCKELDFPSGQDHVTITNLIRGQEYTITLRTVIDKSSSPWVYGADEYPVLTVTPLRTVEEPATQPNALASYNNATNQVQVNWDFTISPAPTTCFLKGDVWYYKDLNDDVNVNNLVRSFTPLFYSAVTSTPVIIQATNDDVNFVEEVPCVGDMRIDIDTIMNHSQNTNNYQSLGIFLTFYFPDSNGDFNTLDKYRIDEVLVMYSPTITFNNEAKDWGCGSQIGNTLYIDASSIHGNNGDNCDVYPSLKNNEWIDIGMVGSGSKGEQVSGTHNKLFSPLIQVSIEIETETKKKSSGGSGDNRHLTRPSFGISHSTFNPQVQCGYSHNGICYDITNNWYTPFDKVEIKTGEPQEIIIKGYFPNGVKGFNWGLIPEVGEFHKSEVKIQVEINHLDEIENTDIYQKHNILDMDSIIYEYYQESCGYIDSKCDVLKMSNVIFMVEPVFEKIAIYGIDDQRRTHLTSLNEGYDIFGESLNEPLESKVNVGKGGAFYPQNRGTVDLKLVEYKTCTWQDEYGYLWQCDNYKSFKIISVIPVPIKEPDKLGTIIDRGHSEFYRITEYELKRALEIFDSTKLISELPDPVLGLIISPLINEELEILKTEYNKQVESFKAEKYLMDIQPAYKKIYQKYQTDYEELKQKHEESLSSLLLQIKELEHPIS